MTVEHAKLQHAISDYGKAMEAWARSGEPRGSELHRIACEKWGEVNDLLDKAFRPSLLSRAMQAAFARE